MSPIAPPSTLPSLDTLLPADALLSHPLTALDQLFTQHPDLLANHDLQQQLTTHMQTLLTRHSASIPSLNSVPVETLRPHSLVRFHGMIQDIYSPEYYLLQHADTKSNAVRIGKYRDSIQLDPTTDEDAEELELTNVGNVTKERTRVNAIQIPGESKWVSELLDGSAATTTPSNATQSAGKRSYAATDDQPMSEKRSRSEADHSQSLQPAEKKTNEEKQQQPDDIIHINSDAGLRHHVITLYDQLAAQVKVGEIYDFVGILSEEDTLSAPDAMNDDGLSSQPIFSSRPIRFHALCGSKLPAILQNTVQQPTSEQQLVETLKQFASSHHNTSLQATTIQYLSQALHVDTLSAQTLLLSMLAHIHSRTQGSLVGKLTCNVVLPVEMSAEQCKTFAATLQSTLATLLPMLLTVNIDVATLNAKRFQPVKDYDQERLQYGLLQLPVGSYLLCNETQMTAGKLETNGVLNINSLAKLINEQVVDYDYIYSTLPFPTDVSICTVSRGKSMLPADLRCYVQLTQSDTKVSPDSQTLGMIRQYLQVARQMPFTLTEQSSKPIEEYLIALRAGSKNVTEDVLHTIVTIARLFAGAALESELSASQWQQVRSYIDEVRQRERQATVNASTAA